MDSDDESHDFYLEKVKAEAAAAAAEDDDDDDENESSGTMFSCCRRRVLCSVIFRASNRLTSLSMQNIFEPIISAPSAQHTYAIIVPSN